MLFGLDCSFRYKEGGLAGDQNMQKDRDMLTSLWLKNLETQHPKVVKLRFCRLVLPFDHPLVSLVQSSSLRTLTTLCQVPMTTRKR